MGRDAGLLGFVIRDHFARQADNFVVAQTFLAVGQLRKAMVHRIELFAGQRNAQILAALGQRVTAAVLAEHQFRLGHAHRLRIHDFVRRPLFQESVLVDAGFMREGVLADNRLVGLRPEGDQRREQLAAREEMLGHDAGFERQHGRGGCSAP